MTGKRCAGDGGYRSLPVLLEFAVRGEVLKEDAGQSDRCLVASFRPLGALNDRSN